MTWVTPRCCGAPMHNAVHVHRGHRPNRSVDENVWVCLRCRRRQRTVLTYKPGVASFLTSLLGAWIDESQDRRR